MPPSPSLARHACTFPAASARSAAARARLMSAVAAASFFIAALSASSDWLSASFFAEGRLFIASDSATSGSDGGGGTEEEPAAAAARAADASTRARFLPFDEDASLFAARVSPASTIFGNGMKCPLLRLLRLLRDETPQTPNFDESLDESSTQNQHTLCLVFITTYCM